LATVERLVEIVHAAGARVAAHSTTRHVTELIRAGVDSVEHGPAMDESDLGNLAAGHGAWTPTLCAAVGEPQSDLERQRRQHEMRDRLTYLLPAAIARGVTVMTGTDVVGTVPREVALLTELGLTPTQALAAATTAARRFLGFPDLHEGEPADLVTYDHDPRNDPAILNQPVAVMRQGIRLR
jgi:imidazolonepropionase-like amidohydrolase